MNYVAIALIILCGSISVYCFIMAAKIIARQWRKAEDMIKKLNQDLDSEEHLGI